MHTGQLQYERLQYSENGGREDHVTEGYEEHGKSLSRKGMCDAVDRIMVCEEDGRTLVDDGQTRATVRMCGYNVVDGGQPICLEEENEELAIFEVRSVKR